MPFEISPGIYLNNKLSHHSFIDKQKFLMPKNNSTSIVAISALLITILFHKQSLGLNLLIYETGLMLWLVISKQMTFKTLNSATLSLGLMITAIFTVITHSVFSYLVNFLVLFLFIGLLIFPEAKSLINSFGLSAYNVINSQIQFLKNLSASKLMGNKFGKLLWKFRIFLIPVFIVFLFVLIYKGSNPFFKILVDDIVVFISEKLSFILEGVDFQLIITFLIGLFISVFIFIRTSNKDFILQDVKSDEVLQRNRNKALKSFGMKSLLNEYSAGVFLLIILNLLILTVNVIDIKWVWFGFEWEGQYLKQFVHEGTYLLILSILISIILVLYYFRGNLNFYKNNKLLKYLSFIWLMQNGILAISVAIRNFWYINYFALAYKRIGVIVFLALTLYGLYAVYRKVSRRKSAFYLFKTNSYALLVVLILTSTINWDIVIAKYNFKHADHSFLHLDYLSGLSDKALPYLDKSLSDLQQIDKIQKEKFPFEKKYMTPEEYHSIIEQRKILFLEKWQSKSFLSWNLAEYLAVKKLTAESGEEE